MRSWGPLIPATRWSCSQPKLIAMTANAAPPSGWDKGCPDKHHRFSAECMVSLIPENNIDSKFKQQLQWNTWNIRPEDLKINEMVKLWKTNLLVSFKGCPIPLHTIKNASFVGYI